MLCASRFALQSSRHQHRTDARRESLRLAQNHAVNGFAPFKNATLVAKGSEIVRARCMVSPVAWWAGHAWCPSVSTHSTASGRWPSRRSTMRIPALNSVQRHSVAAHPPRPEPESGPRNHRNGDRIFFINTTSALGTWNFRGR